MLKRLTYLEKHTAMTAERFFAHWSTTHADIARDLPGVVSYLQNHVIQHRPCQGASVPYRVDGIVELWFASPDVVDAAQESEASDRLVVDERKFLRGLTGGPVVSTRPHPHWPFKVWVLGLAAEAPSESAEEWLRLMTTDMPGVSGTELNRLEENPRLLTRPNLRSEPRIPEVAMAVGFQTEEQARAGAETLAGRTELLRYAVTNRHVYVAAEVPIV